MSRTRRGMVRSLAVLLGTASAALVLTAGPAAAAPSLQASPRNDLDPSGVTVTVTGSGYDESKGIYVAFCVDRGPGQIPTPCGGGVDMSGSTGSSVWISSNPPPYGVDLARPYGPGGSFQVTIRVEAEIAAGIDCRTVTCSIVTRNDHTRSGDRSQDVAIPLTFRSPSTPPPTTPPTTPPPTTTTPNPGTSSPSTPATPPSGSGGTPGSPSPSATPSPTPSGASPTATPTDEPTGPDDTAGEPTPDATTAATATPDRWVRYRPSSPTATPEPTDEVDGTDAADDGQEPDEVVIAAPDGGGDRSPLVPIAGAAVVAGGLGGLVLGVRRRRGAGT